jgi:hypothetical protein
MRWAVWREIETDELAPALRRTAAVLVGVLTSARSRRRKSGTLGTPTKGTD